MYEVVFADQDSEGREGYVSELTSDWERTVAENRPFLRAGESVSVYRVLSGKVERVFFERIA